MCLCKVLYGVGSRNGLLEVHEVRFWVSRLTFGVGRPPRAAARIWLWTPSEKSA